MWQNVFSKRVDVPSALMEYEMWSKWKNCAIEAKLKIAVGITKYIIQTCARTK